MPDYPTFSPDGSKLAFIRIDGQVGVHDLIVDADVRVGPRRNAPDVGQLWRDLGASDSRVAYRAACSLVLAPAQAIPFLDRNLRPVPSSVSRTIEQAVADLDHDEFKRRTDAERELARLGPLCELPLRNALARSVSLEQRTRAERLLRRAPGLLKHSDEDLRRLRAVWVLQRIGTPAARATLKELARGAPEARQTSSARTALRFLAPPPASKVKFR